MQPFLNHRKDVSGLIEDPPSLNKEIKLVMVPKTKAEYNNADFHLNGAFCRFLLFWCLITTISSMLSIYYAIDAQNRLNEANDNLNLLKDVENNSEPRYHDLAHRFAPFVERASAARRHRHRHHGHKSHKKTKKITNKINDIKPNTTSEIKTPSKI